MVWPDGFSCRPASSLLLVHEVAPHRQPIVFGPRMDVHEQPAQKDEDRSDRDQKPGHNPREDAHSLKALRGRSAFGGRAIMYPTLLTVWMSSP